MRGDAKSIVWGIILIVIGFLFLGNNLGWFYFEWSELWPLLMVGGGVLFWLNWLINRKEVGLLMPGTILISYGLLFLYCSLYGWDWMQELWPVFLLGPGLGFLFMYFFGPSEKGLLVPAIILILLSFFFWSGLPFFRLFWPLLLIGIGIYLLLRSRRKEDFIEVKSTEESSKPKD